MGGRRDKYLPCLIILLFYFSTSIALENGRTLYINRDDEISTNKYKVINLNSDNTNGTVRKKRDAPISDVTSLNNKNISSWITHLNDSHQQLMVHWVGEGSSVIMCLARDPNPRPSKSRPSAVYISYDYGKTFQNKTEQFKLTSEMNSGYAQLDKMFNHPKYPSHCIFTDTANKIIFYTSDNGLHIGYTSLPFHPKMIAFDEELPEKFVVWDSEDPRKRLYLTEDGGRTFDMIQELVKSFYWTSGVDFPNSIFYYERLEPNGTSTVFSTPDPNSIDSSRILMRNVEDFLIKGEYMFATQKTKNSNMELYISYRRGAFYKAVFQTELDLKRFHISDVTSERLMVSVVHTEVMSNLYVSEMDSNRTQISFVLSLENIMCYFPSVTFKDSWLEDVAEEPFAELYKVEGMKGIYIASKFEGRTSMNVIGLEHLVSLITFDHGVKWSRITPPNMDENGMPISCGLENSCSLHLSQKFSHLYPVSRSPSIMSSKSAPGLIIATGVLGKSMKGVPGVFISKDAGLSWRRIFKDYFFFNFGDHGGVLVAVRYYKSRGETRQLLFSTDEGATWGSFQFHDDDLRIYGLMTEPGENTTTFTMFGSANAQHQWIILTVDLLKAFNRTCTSSDYKFWSPTAANSSINCVMGLREIYERRIPNRNCYNGLDYNRPTQKQSCECSRRDYECAFGFTLSGKECIKSNTTKFDPYKIPASCQPGQYYKRTKGYRKIDGNQCVSDFYVRYEPEWTPCPMAETAEFMVLAVKDNLTRINLQDNTTITYPIKGLKNLVAVEFDMRNNCVYWADLDKDKITRQCLSGDSQPEIIVDYDLNSVEGMAFDWISNVLFFVDGTRRKIEAVSVVPSYGNRFRRTILDSDKLFKPRGITVHPKAGYLFWTDWDSQHVSVSRANLDGTNTIKLFSGPDVIWPNGITIDYTSDRIFWVDAMADYIGCSDLDGHYMRRIISDDSRVTHPFAIAVLKDKIYWDDWKVNSVFMADKDKGTNITVIKNMTATPMDLKVFAHFIQYGTNACTNNTICKYMCLGGPKNTYSCLCPDGLKEKNGKCLCPGDVEPDSNFVCPHKDVVCGNKEFQCMNGSCISSLLKCNRHNDCGDNSDEINCSRCPLGTFTCGGGGNKCLPNEWKCDGDFDCDDNSDEIGCERPLCTADQFRCKDGFCRSKEYLCDGDYDCKDGSDEANCKKTTQACRENDYKCPDTGRCIPYTWLCDGDVDCQGDEDPKMCSNITCQPNMFKCLGNGKCINNAWLCDGEDDCGDPQRSDEMNCTAKPVRPPATLIPTSDNDSKRCLDWMFTCANSKCVSLWWRCDGVDDCGDNSDEVGCPVKHPDSIITPPEPTQPTTVQLCGRDQFTCYKDRACIPQRWWCDGLIDCIDGSDERDCPFQLPMPSTPASSPCGPKQVECRSGGECISLNQLCDGNADCRDKSDEMHCSAVKYPVDCNPTSMMCDEGKRCIPLSKKCDGNIDCFDGTDEKDCLSSKYNVQLAVIAASTKNTSFEVHIWLSQKSGVNYTFLPSYTELGKNNWTNLTWTDKYYFKFVNMRPNTSYNVTCYVRDSSTNRTVPSNAYITVKTRFGVPPAPKKLEAIQLTGRRVRLVWDGTNDTSVTYAIKSSPQLPYIITHNTEINITSDFIPGQKYSFWVIATNPEHISEPSETAVLTFDSLGDVDDLVNASIVNRTDSSVTLKWNRIPGVEGYTVRLKLPKLYAQVEPIVTKENVATVNDLPPGLSLYIELRAFKNGIKGTPLTIPYKTVGVERQSVDNVTVKSVKGQFNTYEVSWSQTKVSGQQYEVHYTNGKLSDLFNAPEVVTTANKIIISNLTECSQYLIAVSLYRGPLSEPIMIQTDTKNISVSSLKADVNKATSELIVSWSMTCNVIKEPIRYMVELVEENTNRVSSYLLNATLNYNLVHIVRGLPTGAKFTVCVWNYNDSLSPHKCVGVGTTGLASPAGLVSYFAHDGQNLLVNWDTENQTANRYQVLVAANEIPMTRLRFNKDVYVFNTSRPPFSVTLPQVLHDVSPLYVGIRSLTDDGYTSDMSQVSAIHMSDWLTRKEDASSSTGFFWGVCAAVLLSALCMTVLFIVVRRRANAFNMLHSFTMRNHQDDDDNPPISGFSDDEPLVIA